LTNSCVNGNDHSVPIVNCEEPLLQVTNTIGQIKEMASFGIIEFTEDIIIEGYVVSSDKLGNIYKSIFIQDLPKNPTAAICIVVDQTNTYVKYPVGRKLFVKLKRLSIAYNRGVLEIGKAIGGQLKRIPNLEVDKHIFRSCETATIVPKKVNFSDLNNSMTSMLLAFEVIQFKENELGKTYANLENTHSVDRVLEQLSTSCHFKDEIVLRNSGFSNFKSFELPKGKGMLIALLSQYYSKYQLLLRNSEDVFFTEERCNLSNTLKPTITFSELKEMYQGSMVEFGIEQDLILEAYVISTDEAGNFSKRIFIQNAIENPSGGLQILINEDAIYENYHVGNRVLLKLNRLYMDKVNGVLTIGYPDKTSVKEIENGFMQNFIINTEQHYKITPKLISLSELTLDTFQNTLVKLEDVQLISSEQGKAYTYYSGTNEGFRTLETCGVLSKIKIYTNGNAFFANNKFPLGNGAIVGVLYRKNSQWLIQIRSLEDMTLVNPYKACPLIVPKLLITEVADPKNSSNSRFVELYNAGDSPLDLTDWKLCKYINGSSIISGSGLSLSGFVLAPKEFLLVANSTFGSMFGFAPDILSTYITGNGDDVYELRDSGGNVQDVFGLIGTDGTGTSWEYTDGKAIRKKSIVTPNPNFTIAEWEVFSKAIDSEQLAPQNFNPNVR